jgi:ArsR family transcriptional regulator
VTAQIAEAIGNLSFFMSAVKKSQKTTIRCEDNFIHEDKVRLAEKNLVDGLTATKLARTYQALADPTRVRIISALSSTELCVCDIAALLGISQSAISHQLRQMRDLRLVKTRKEGRIVYYALDDEHIRDLFNRGFEHLKHE